MFYLWEKKRDMKRTILKRKKVSIRRNTKDPTEVMRKKCVKLAKYIARATAEFTCEYCGKCEPDVRTHGSHVFSEGVHRAMSADVDNIICLCFTHHTGIWNAKEPSWHNNPMEMTEWFRMAYPDRAKMLQERTLQHPTCDLKFWQDKYQSLTQTYGNYL